MIKFFGLLTFASLSVSAFGQTCYVDMVNSYNQVIRSYTSYDVSSGCKEGMKQCRLAIRTEPHLGGVDCVRDLGQGRPVPSPIPTPIPTPRPDPRPYPPQQPDYGYPFHIIIGEKIYNTSNNRYAEVLSQDFNGKYVLKFTDNGAIGTGWTREDLAPLRGCDKDICVNTKIFNVSNNRYATVVGLQMEAKFVLRFEDNGAVGDGWSREDFAVLQGCDYEVCVGEQVYNTENNRYAEIAGLQVDGKYVLRFKDNGAVGDGWSRQDFAVMKGCQSGLCVGSRVINVQNRRYATVVALQSNGRFVLRFEDNGATGDGWDLTDLAPIR